jgi:mannose-6-phosphate isomerase
MILFFEPIGRFAIWGHNTVKNYFGYSTFPDGIGQFWSFSAQPGASNFCLSDPYRGMTFQQIWSNHQELFDSRYQTFPLLISLVGPEDDLSIQVHPNIEQAKKIGYEIGKNEAWYFLKTADHSRIAYGHNARNESEFRARVKANDWASLIRYRKMSEGDFVYIPAGVIHAMGKGNIVYEIQQATDVTYRLYDYDRCDKEGKKRSLNFEEGLAVVSYDPDMMKVEPQSQLEIISQSSVLSYFCPPDFIVKRLIVKGELPIKLQSYGLATVVSGQGNIQGQSVKLGDNVLITQGSEPIQFDGDMMVMITTEWS